MPVAVALPIGVVVIVTAAFFYSATTFIGDDHLFLAFARYVPDPLIAFVRDQHGGEFYRPLPMVVWWLLGRLAGGAKWPFAALSFALHLVVSLELGALVLAVRRREQTDPLQSSDGAPASALRAGIIAALLFFVAPITQEAAFWYAASTDLFATAFGLGALLAWSRARFMLALPLFAAACWSKETALVLPALAVLIVPKQPQKEFEQPGPSRFRFMLARVAPWGVVALLFLLARTAVLRGLGNIVSDGEPSATLPGKLLQLTAGLIHLVAGSAISNEPLAWILGLLAWAALLITAHQRRRLARRVAAPLASGSASARGPYLPLAWVVVSLVPLLAAPWIVGARYFYLPAVGLAWFAAEVLAPGPTPLAVAMLAVLAGLSVGQAWQRRADVTSYEARLSATRRAVADGLAHGVNTFHVAAGIKDLDLAVKEDLRFAPHEPDLLVLGDVPSSFVALPPARGATVDFLLARPQVPPSGAYAFGARRVVGLARRGDDPTLDEVVAHFPAIRFIRLRLGPQGHIIPRDVTDKITGEAAEDDSIGD
ncbi:MAG: hypothetical protein ABIS92_16220 [Polyangia bacterium]